MESAFFVAGSIRARLGQFEISNHEMELAVLGGGAIRPRL
jgi:hypothetical protein